MGRPNLRASPNINGVVLATSKTLCRKLSPWRPAWAPATFASAAELKSVTDNYDGQRSSWIGLTDDPKFGGTESALEPIPQVDGWVWVTGEPVTYTNWFSAGNPDNRNGSEHYVVMGDGRVIGGWNDDVGHLPWHLIEFEAEVESLPLDDFDLNNDGIINPTDRGCVCCPRNFWFNRPSIRPQ